MTETQIKPTLAELEQELIEAERSYIHAVSEERNVIMIRRNTEERFTKARKALDMKIEKLREESRSNSSLKWDVYKNPNG